MTHWERDEGSSAIRRTAYIGVIAFALLALYLLAWPTPIDPVAWQPPPNAGLTGPFTPNDALAGIEHLVELGPGPEDMAKGPDGLIYTGLQDGRIVRFDPDSGAPAETFVSTGGRPLGMEFDAAGRLYVADAFAGLLAITPGGDITVLADAVGGEPMLFVNDLDVGVPGKIFFTDSSRRFDQEHYMLDFIEGRQTGRLLSYDLTSGETEVHLDGLAFANGVAVGPDGNSVWVAETLTARIRQVLAGGGSATTGSTLIEHLPGYPDNLSFNADRTILWVALPAVRPNPVEALAARPFLRKVLTRIPGLSALRIDPYSMVIGLDPAGRVVHNLQDPAGGYPTITSVKEIDGYLYFGSIDATALARMPVPEERLSMGRSNIGTK